MLTHKTQPLVIKGYNLTTGTNNTLIGTHVASGDSITGTNNTCVGATAGHGLTSGSNNLLLGHDAGRGRWTVR